MTSNVKLNDTLLDLVRASTVTPRIVPFLFGEAGIGKTSWAKALGEHVYVVECNLLADKADVTGVDRETGPDGRKYQVFYPMETILRANDAAKENPDDIVYIVFDEINRATSDITSAVQTIPTSRRNGSLDLEDNIRFIFTGNDHGNVEPLDSASMTRYVAWHVEPDADIFLDLMGNRLNKWVASVLTENPDMIISRPTSGESAATVSVDGDDATEVFSQFDTEEEFTQMTVPRTLEGLSDTLNQFNDDQISNLIAQPGANKDNMFQTMVYAHIGETPFAYRLIENVAKYFENKKIQSMGTTGTATTNTFQPDNFTDETLQVLDATFLSDVHDLIDDMDAHARGDLFYAAAFDSTTYLTASKGRNFTKSNIHKLNTKKSAIVEQLLNYTESNDIKLGKPKLVHLVSESDKLDNEILTLISEKQYAGSAIAQNYGILLPD